MDILFRKKKRRIRKTSGLRTAGFLQNTRRIDETDILGKSVFDTRTFVHSDKKTRKITKEN